VKVISLFSGAGGLDLGFMQAGYSVVWANDIDSDAVETYRHNIGDHIILGDIKELDLDDLPDCDVVIGGFPCQGFSMANAKRSKLDERNKLYMEFLRVLEAKKPKYFVAENVKGILSLGQGEVIKAIVKDFESAGYKVKHELLNAADFGVPQTRQRVFIVGVRDDLDFNYIFPSPTHSREGKDDLKKWVSVSEAISGLPDPDKPNDVKNHVYSKYKLVFNGYLGKRPLHPDLPAPTVTARGDRKGGVVVLPHPNGERRMSIRELATVQSFPRDYEFLGTNSDCYRQIGNAVPVELAKAVAQAL